MYSQPRAIPSLEHFSNSKVPTTRLVVARELDHRALEEHHPSGISGNPAVKELDVASTGFELAHGTPLTGC